MAKGELAPLARIAGIDRKEGGRNRTVMTKGSMTRSRRHIMHMPTVGLFRVDFAKDHIKGGKT